MGKLNTITIHIHTTSQWENRMQDDGDEQRLRFDVNLALETALKSFARQVARLTGGYVYVGCEIETTDGTHV